MKIGDYVVWERHNPHDLAPKIGYWQITGAPKFYCREGERQGEMHVKLRWVSGWRMYHDQKKAFRPVRELRLLQPEQEVRCYVRIRAREFLKRVCNV